jgi:hypothetical protein
MIGTPKVITHAIIHGITQWTVRQDEQLAPQRSPTFGSIRPVDVAISQAYQEQTNNLGWDNLLRGRLSKLWSKAYASYQVSVISNSPASHWTTKIILKLWDYTSSLWQH